MQCEKCNVEMKKGYVVQGGRWFEGEIPLKETAVIDRIGGRVIGKKNMLLVTTWVCANCGLVTNSVTPDDLKSYVS